MEAEEEAEEDAEGEEGEAERLITRATARRRVNSRGRTRAFRTGHDDYS